MAGDMKECCTAVGTAVRQCRFSGSAVGKRKILIVEDSPTQLQMTQFFLEQGGYEVITATSGEEGVSKAEEGSPGLILMDINMPGMDGWEATRRIKAKEGGKPIPIVMLTDQDRGADVEKAHEVGATDYIVKPFTPPVLLEKVRKILSQT